MSEHATSTAAAREPVTLDTGLEAFRSSSEFSGPVEDLDGHHCNDHFAHIYESQQEKFAAAAPFTRHGLERGERVMYVVDESTEADVIAALRDAGVDVDTALESGALTFHTVDETYLRNGSFDVDEMIEFYGDTVAEATEEYEALRIVAEMTWLNDDATTVEQFMEYEQKVNELFSETDSLAICQYNRELFAPEVIRTVVRTHPHLIYDGTACHNFYYTPPEEFFGSDAPAREVDRMLGTLRDRVAAKSELQHRDQLLRDLYVIAASQEQSFEAKLDVLFELGCEQFDLDFGFLNRVDPAADHLEIEHASSDDHEHYKVGGELPLSETYCKAAVDIEAAASIADPDEEGYDDLFVYEEFGVDGYLGTYIPVDGGPDRTLAFVPDADAESVSVSEQDRMYLELMGQWIGYELNRRQREQFLRECYDITSNPARDFEEKLHALLDLGCEQFGLDYGGMARIDPESDRLEVETMNSDHDHLYPGKQVPLSETHCRLIADHTETVGVADAVADGLDDTTSYAEFGVNAYLGTRLPLAGTRDTTLFFFSAESRDRAFTDEERTFVHLMGQWVKYELERRQREAELRQTKNRFETVFEQSNDGIFLIDPDADKFVDANPAAAEMLGYSRDELASLPPSDVHPDELEQFRAFLEEARETGSAWSEDLHCRTKDGRDLPAEVSASAITLDDRELVLANVRHVEERKKHERYQRELYDIVADLGTSLDEKLDRLLELGRERFGLENGYFNHVDAAGDEFEVVAAVGPHDMIEPGAVDEICGTFCETHLDSAEPLAAADVCDAGLDHLRAHDEYGLEAYFAATVHVGGEEYGTLCFASESPRDRPFTEAERTFLDLMGRCIGYELEHRRRERFLRESHEITADPDLSFDAKLEQLLDLGREWMGLDAAGLTHLPEWDGKFLTEYAVGYGDENGTIDASDDVWTDPGEGCFCREVITADDPVGMADVRGTAWEHDRIHQQHGLTSYLGTKVTSGSTPYGTLWVGSTEPRDRPFTDTERTFLDLIGQWVSYELERRELNDAQRELYGVVADPALDTEAKLDRLLDVGCDYLNLPVGLVTCEREDAFEIERMHGDHPDLGEGTLTPPLTDNYCRRVVDTGEPISVSDVGAAGWDGDALYHEFGLECYAGVQLTVGDEPYGTICFTDLSPREAEFTEAEQTFLDLMGQCASYELERHHREAQLKDKNDRLENFASMLAHELRNPVTIGQIYSQQLPEETDAEAVEYVAEAFDRIENMVDVMLVLTRGREAVDERTPVALAEVSREAWADVDAPEAVVDIATDQIIPADETYIRHLFRNLLANAVDHGGADVTVEVGELPDGDGFYVADDGPGIPAEDRDRVFDEGYTTASDNGGTGLGLAFVQKLADVYDWDLAVTDSETGGARFEFRNVTQDTQN